MDTTRKRYSSEFNRCAFELAVTSGKSMAEIERDLGLRAGLLKHWVRKVKAAGAQAFPGHGRQKAEEEEMRRLKRELEIVSEERDIQKSSGHLFARPSERYGFIERERPQHTVTLLCKVLGVSVSGYNKWRQWLQSKGQQENQTLMQEIRRIPEESRQIYGSPRIHAELQAGGWQCGEKRVARLMRQAGIQGKCKRRRRICTTDSSHHLPGAPNLLDQDFQADRPDQKWLVDMSYVPTAEGWLFLAVVLDVFSRKVIGWAMDAAMTSELVTRALGAALTTRQPGADLLHHSDRGSQYTSDDYQAILRSHGIAVSMSRTGNCYDNAMMESFFATIKAELIHDQQYLSRSQARQDIFHYIEGFYNRRRRHSSLRYLCPNAFEQLHSPGTN